MPQRQISSSGPAPARWLLSPSFVPVCLAAALAVRLAWVLTVAASPIDDFSWYYDRAVEVAAGKGVVFHGVPTAYWPVGYPFMLAALFVMTGPSLIAAKLLNVALAMAILWLAYRIAGKLFSSEIAARLTLLILSFYPNQIAYTALTASETPFLFLMLLGLLMLLHRRAGWGMTVLAGVDFGLGCLTKPTMLFVPAVFFALAMIHRPRARLAVRGAVVYLALGLTVLPWTLRNQRVFGHPVFVVTSGGINLLIGNNPQATGGYAAPGAATTRILDAQPDEHRRDLAARSLAVEYMKGHPLETLSRVPWRVWHMYAKDVEGLYWVELAGGAREGPVRERPFFLLKIVAQVYYMAVLALFAGGLLRFYVLGRPPFPRGAVSALGLGIILYFTAIIMLLFGSTRLHFPLIPWFAAYGSAWAAALIAPAHWQVRLPHAALTPATARPGFEARS